MRFIHALHELLIVSECVVVSLVIRFDGCFQRNGLSYFEPVRYNRINVGFRNHQTKNLVKILQFSSLAHILFYISNASSAVLLLRNMSIKYGSDNFAIEWFLGTKLNFSKLHEFYSKIYLFERFSICFEHCKTINALNFKIRSLDLQQPPSKFHLLYTKSNHVMKQLQLILPFSIFMIKHSNRHTSTSAHTC